MTGTGIGRLSAGELLELYGAMQRAAERTTPHQVIADTPLELAGSQSAMGQEAAAIAGWIKGELLVRLDRAGGEQR